MPTQEKSPEQIVAAKLVKIREQVSHVPKNGTHGQGYKFAQWQDVVEAVRAKLDEEGLFLKLSVADVEVIGTNLVLATITYEWIDVESGATLSGVWAGTGWDKGDKALYKAFTGALKYLVLDSFMIPTGDDPEAGNQPPEDGSASAQPASQRQAAGSPVIPRDRAQKIVKAGKDAGLTEAVYKSILADVAGHTKVTKLTVDEAETVEARIAAEATKGGASS